MIEIFQQIQEESQGLVHCPSNQLYKNPMEYFQTFYKVSTFLEGHMMVMLLFFVSCEHMECV